ncbi:MAG: hypothetical protein NZ528_14755, partial [Caldilineales bacterium]|nr:hypothetical protein [Caldilineales bacterium]
GLHEGTQQGVLAGIEVALDLKFGTEGLRLLPEIRKIEDLDVLSAVLSAIRTAATLDDVRRIYAS